MVNGSARNEAIFATWREEGPTGTALARFSKGGLEPREGASRSRVGREEVARRSQGTRYVAAK
jgi:hypothetical protein